MMRDKERERRIRAAILEELTNTPRGYMQTQRSLLASMGLSLVPPPSEVEYDEALARLEADCFIHCEISALGEKRWCVTSLGRAAFNDR